MNGKAGRQRQTDRLMKRDHLFLSTELIKFFNSFFLFFNYFFPKQGGSLGPLGPSPRSPTEWCKLRVMLMRFFKKISEAFMEGLCWANSFYTPLRILCSASRCSSDHCLLRNLFLFLLYLVISGLSEFIVQQTLLQDIIKEMHFKMGPRNTKKNSENWEISSESSSTVLLSVWHGMQFIIRGSI